MQDFPADELEFQRLWSSKSGETAALEQVIALLNKRTADAYVRHRDEVATDLRNAASAVVELHRNAADDLREFIEADKKRQYERRPKH